MFTTSPIESIVISDKQVLMKNINVIKYSIVLLILFFGYSPTVNATTTNFSQQIYAITECNDGIDNDFDGGIDFATDDQCVSWEDDSELILEPECSDTLDNDSDTFKDYPLDPQCSTPNDNTENIVEPQCSDGLDNDFDSFIDFPLDPDCTDADDNLEDTSSDVVTPEPEPATPQSTSNIATDIFTSDIVDDIVNVGERIVFEWSPLGRVLGINSFNDVVDLPLQSRIPVIIITSLLFSLIAGATIIALNTSFKLLKNYVFAIFIPKVTA